MNESVSYSRGKKSFFFINLSSVLDSSSRGDANSPGIQYIEVWMNEAKPKKIPWIFLDLQTLRNAEDHRIILYLHTVLTCLAASFRI